MSTLLQAIFNISSLLSHPLQKQKDIDANFEDCAGRADIVVCKGVLSVSELRDNTLVILFAPLYAKVVNLNVHSVLQLEEFNDISSAISDSCLSAGCWISKSYHVVCDVSQIQVETISFKPILLL